MPRRLRRGIVVSAAVVVAATAIWLYVTRGSFVVDRLASPEQWMHTDFDTFWRSAVALVEGRDVYLDTGAYLVNLNPPVFTALVAPYGLLDFWAAYRLFTLVSVLLMVASLLLVAVELRLPTTPAAAVLTAVLLSSPMLATVGLGQMYPMLTAGLVAAWLLERRGQPALSGVAIGLVVALKPTLAPLLLVPLARRHWETVAGGVVAGALATIVGWVATGATSLPTWLGLAWTHPVQAFWDNASLVGAFTRLTSATEWGRPLFEAAGGPTVGVLCGAVLIAVTTWTVHRSSGGGLDTALWAMAAASLLASPIAWHNYLLVLAPGLLVLASAGRWPIAALLAACGLIGNEWPGWWYGPDGTASAVPLSLYTAILLAYWAALVRWPWDVRGDVVPTNARAAETGWLGVGVAEQRATGEVRSCSAS